MTEKEVKIIAFDFDDTLIKTKDASAGNVRIALLKYQQNVEYFGTRFEVPSIEILLEHYGVSYENSGRSSWSDWILESCKDLIPEDVEDFRKFYFENKDNLPYHYNAVEKASECLNNLCSEGYHLALVTGRTSTFLDERMKCAGINSALFKKIIHQDENPHKKPSPDFFNSFVEWAFINYRVGEENCLYVGDTVHDAKSALGAGMKFIGVLTGPAKKEDFINAEVMEYNILDSVANLPERLKRGGL